VFRPWGSYDSLENQDGFQVKRLVVKPGDYLGEDDTVRLEDNYGREGTTT